MKELSGAIGRRLDRIKQPIQRLWKDMRSDSDKGYTLFREFFDALQPPIDISPKPRRQSSQDYSDLIATAAFPEVLQDPILKLPDEHPR